MKRTVTFDDDPDEWPVEDEEEFGIEENDDLMIYSWDEHGPKVEFASRALRALGPIRYDHRYPDPSRGSATANRPSSPISATTALCYVPSSAQPSLPADSEDDMPSPTQPLRPEDADAYMPPLTHSSRSEDIEDDVSSAESQPSQKDMPLFSQLPPSSYFSCSQQFQPDLTAPFEQEFSRYMSSQGIAQHTCEFKRERTKAIAEEITFHYGALAIVAPCMSQEERRRAQRLQIYQRMCEVIGLPKGSTEKECLHTLRSILVNIVDFIDQGRLGRPVKIWTDFEAFSKYSLQDGKRIDLQEAKESGFLKALLRKLGGRADRRQRKKRRRAGNSIYL